MSKANNHPIVRDLRRLLDKHGWQGAVIVAIRDDGYPQYVSAGKTVAKCNALGPVLKEPEVEMLAYEMSSRLEDDATREERRRALDDLARMHQDMGGYE